MNFNQLFWNIFQTMEIALVYFFNCFTVTAIGVDSMNPVYTNGNAVLSKQQWQLLTRKNTPTLIVLTMKEVTYKLIHCFWFII